MRSINNIECAEPGVAVDPRVSLAASASANTCSLHSTPPAAPPPTRNPAPPTGWSLTRTCDPERERNKGYFSSAVRKQINKVTLKLKY